MQPCPDAIPMPLTVQDGVADFAAALRDLFGADAIAVARRQLRDAGWDTRSIWADVVSFLAEELRC